MTVAGPVLAVDPGGSSIKAEVLDERLAVHATARGTTPAEPGRVLAEVLAVAQRALAAAPAGQRPVRVGLAVPGVVDPGAGVAVRSANLGWRDEPVAVRAARALGLPVVLGHDVTLAGLAEHRCGAARGLDRAAVVVCGTGIAAALVGGGDLLTGGLGQPGELGHVVVRPDGPPCACGRRGCLEALASAGAIARRYTQRSGRSVAGAREVCERLGVDEVADDVWGEAVDALADGLLTVSALLAPERVVLGGGLAESGPALLDPLRAALAARVTVERLPAVVPATFGSRAGLVGAALHAWAPAAGATVHQP